MDVDRAFVADKFLLSGSLNEPLLMSVSMEGDAVVIAVSGDLDIASGAQLEACTEAMFPLTARVVIDLREVSFMDSSGLQALLAARAAALGAERELVLRSTPPPVAQLLALTGTAERFVVQ